MAENPETWNDDVKAIAKIMDHAAHSDVFGASVMLEIEQAMVAPLRRRILELEVRLRAYRDSPMVHRRCATYDPTLGKKIYKDSYTLESKTDAKLMMWNFNKLCR